MRDRTEPNEQVVWKILLMELESLSLPLGTSMRADIHRAPS